MTNQIKKDKIKAVVSEMLDWSHESMGSEKRVKKEVKNIRYFL